MLNTLGFHPQNQTYMKDITTSSCANKQPLLKWTHPRIADSLSLNHLVRTAELTTPLKYNI